MYYSFYEVRFKYAKLCLFSRGSYHITSDAILKTNSEREKKKR